MNTAAAPAQTGAGPVVFGEVLFDTFPDRRVLGGAPFNVAWNLHGLGQSPLFVGAVGDDGPGQRVRRTMSGWAMDDTGLQVDPAHPTGSVQVTLSGGEPRYEIIADQAYDHVDRDAALAAVRGREGAILYHGSLALRGEQCRDTLAALRECLGGRVFMDVNLRSPWWDASAVHALMARATWVKLNQDELAALTVTPGRQGADAARALREHFGLQAVIVTRASEGAFVIDAGGVLTSCPAPPVHGLVDTVGAGDAFSAVVVMGLINEWGWEVSLRRATAFAARVCALRGATTTDKGFYEMGSGH